MPRHHPAIPPLGIDPPRCRRPPISAAWQCIKDTHTQKGPRHWCVKFENDFEPWLTRWWSHQDYVVAYSEGLFTHDRLDRERLPSSSSATSTVT